MTEREYAYEVGLTPNDRAKIQESLGVHTLSLEDYAHAKEIINELENK